MKGIRDRDRKTFFTEHGFVFMSLRRRTFSILSFVGFLAVIAGFYIQKAVILPEFEALERERAERNMARCRFAVETEIANLSKLAHDYAAWDDTCRFVVDRNRDYVKINLLPEMFRDNEIHMIDILDTQGRKIWCETREPETNREISVKDICDNTLPEDLAFLSAPRTTDKGVSGLVITDRGPMILSAWPITTSDNTGPVRGTLIMGKFLDGRLMRRLREKMQIPFEAESVFRDSLPEDDKVMPGEFAPTGSVSVSYPNENLLRACSVFRDIRGQPALRLCTTMEADILKKGTTAVMYSRVLVVFVGLLLLFVLVLLIGRFVLRPISELTDRIVSIRRSGDLSVRAPVEGDDEIGLLAREFNYLMDRLEEARTNLESVVVERTADLKETNEKLVRENQERVLAEQALRVSEERYRSFFEEDLSGAYIYYPESRLFVCNPAFARIFGFASPEEARHMHPVDLFPDPETNRKVMRMITEQGKIRNHPMELRDVNGKAVHVVTNAAAVRDDRGRITEIKGTLWDVSQEKKLENLLQTAQRLEAIGTLASGIAHDFNNILYPIMGLSELCLEDLPTDGTARKNLEEILKAVIRARDLINQILIFGCDKDREMTPLNIQPILTDTLKLLKASLPSTVEILEDIDGTKRSVLGDPMQIHQVVMNLCTNAYQSLGGEGGRIHVGLHYTQNPSDDAALSGPLDPGSYWKLSVSDTGKGIDPSVLPRIFEPYFSTKPTGEGTGLGLSVVHGIVKTHKGMISVSSRIGEGATFNVYFPIVDVQPIEEVPDEGSETIVGGTEHILLVDDDERVVGMVTQMVQRLGYRVTAMTDSVKALEEFLAGPGHFDVIITDMTMPNLRGDELARRAQAVRPDLPIILCTGYGQEQLKEKESRPGPFLVAKKPLRKQELAALIRKALDG